MASKSGEQSMDDAMEDIRSESERRVFGFQTWGKLLFMHWPLPVSTLRPLIPNELEIDTYNGSAWIGVVPFTMWGIKNRFVPTLPGLSQFHELNVRTYVTYKNRPGVWFFSLDAESRLAVMGARALFHLPYYFARMELIESDGGVYYRSKRRHRGAPDASFQARWTTGDLLETSVPGSLQHFLTERYSMYSERSGRLYRGDIMHDPWPLTDARLLEFDSSMIEAQGIPTPSGDPVLYAAECLRTKIFRMRSLG